MTDSLEEVSKTYIYYEAIKFRYKPLKYRIATTSLVSVSPSVPNAKNIQVRTNNLFAFD